MWYNERVMVGVLGSAVSALHAQTQRIAASSNNIANSQTAGFKATQTSLVSANPLAGGGVLSVLAPNITQSGYIQQTRSGTNLAISGNGFFAVERTAGQNAGQSSAALSFTRAGGFEPNAQGELVNAGGYRLLGVPLDQNGNPAAPLDPAHFEPVNVNGQGQSARATTQVEISLNLDAAETVEGGGSDFTRGLTVIDSLGAEQAINLEFTATGANEFTLNVSDANGAALGAPQVLSFDGSGNLTSDDSFELSGIDFNNGSNPQDISFDISGISQLAGGYSVTSIDQNGAATAELSGVEITGEGIVRANYANGQSADLYLVPLAEFNNPNGLRPIGGQAFASSEESGIANFGRAGESGLGGIRSAALEGSNVDIATEFVNQIQSRFAFQAALKAIQAQDENFEELLNIKA